MQEVLQTDLRAPDILLPLELLHGQGHALVHPSDDSKAAGCSPGTTLLHHHHLLGDVCIPGGISAAAPPC